MKLPLTAKFMIESQVFFHKYDNVEDPGVYAIAKAVVFNDKLVNLETKG